MNSTYFPHFTIGSDAYDKIPDICGEYGKTAVIIGGTKARICLLYTSPSPRDRTRSRMPSSA